MDAIDLSTTAARALELLSASGASEKTLHGYTHTGFGGILRHFQGEGASYATSEMLDLFLVEQRELMEQAAISLWKWGLLRRSCELLKLCAAEDSVALPPLPPWEPALRRPRQSIWKSTPTAEQLGDPENIFTLVWKTNRAMTALDLAATTIQHYRNEGLSILLKRHYEAGTERYSDALLTQAVAEKRLQYERGQTARVSYQNLRKAAALVREMHRTGSVTTGKISAWGLRDPIAPFDALLLEFCADAGEAGILAESTITVARSAIRVFLFEMEDRGIRALSDFTQPNVNACVTSFARRYAGGLTSAIFSVRVFLRFLFQKSILSADLSQSLPELTASRKSFHEGFSADELERLLGQPDTDTAIGKRDYAMMVLAAQSGLRACDVVRLELGSIDWRAREIRIVQHKTGRPLSLPLEPESGNALADYILNGRPQSALPKLFLCHTGVDRPVAARSASAIVSRHMRHAGIVSARRAFHGFRRTFGTSLLQSEAPIELIQQLMGHAQIDSAKPYLSIDEQGLKRCALPLLSRRKADDDR